MICSWCGRLIAFLEHVYVLPLPDLGHAVHAAGCFWEHRQDREEDREELVRHLELGGEA